ncbi:MAG: transposase [Calditrichae bacterium]|nr:transposase [Calditrichota bacterium]MCB9059497.1 transposase [Calditrichia bacterium]
MSYNPDKHHRRSIRLKEYDYTQSGLYFITICVFQRQHLFGKVLNGQMHLNTFGQIAQNEWEKTFKLRSNLAMQDYTIMPNHIHGIIQITGKETGKVTVHRDLTNLERFGKPVKGSVPTIIRSYKSAVTKRINELRKSPGAIVWQRNYYEHIIRDEQALNSISIYIRNNPVKWEDDKFF